MAQKFDFFVTAKRILSPQGKSLMALGDPTQKVGFLFHGTSAVILSVPGSNGTTDALITTSDGWTIQASRNFADLMTDLSATDASTS